MIANDARTYLVVGVDNKLLLQDLVDVFQQPQVLYEDNNKSVSVTGKKYFGLFTLSILPLFFYRITVHIASWFKCSYISYQSTERVLLIKSHLALINGTNILMFENTWRDSDVIRTTFIVTQWSFAFAKCLHLHITTILSLQ